MHNRNAISALLIGLTALSGACARKMPPIAIPAQLSTLEEVESEYHVAPKGSDMDMAEGSGGAYRLKTDYGHLGIGIYVEEGGKEYLEFSIELYDQNDKQFDGQRIVGQNDSAGGSWRGNFLMYAKMQNAAQYAPGTITCAVGELQKKFHARPCAQTTVDDVVRATEAMIKELYTREPQK